MTDSFIKLSWSREISTEDIEMIEPFLVLMYNRTYPHKTVDKCRKYLSIQMNRTMDTRIAPSTLDVLLQHVRHGISQSNIWARCMTLDKVDQNLADLGWFVDDEGEGEQHPV